MDFKDCTYAFEELIKAVQQNQLPVKVERVLRKLVFCDKMIPCIGNKYAFEEFLSKNKPGMYCVIDINSFKQVNDLYGHEVGDEIIIKLGKAIRLAAVEYYKTTNHRAKVFRVGGDEFVIYLEFPLDYKVLFRCLHHHIFSLPLLENKKRVSVSLGCGPTYSMADSHLLKAKSTKKFYYKKRTKHLPNIFMGEIAANQNVEYIDGVSALTCF